VSIKLAMSGYYQAAFVHVRDILETAYLLDYMLSNREKITIWKTADKRRLQTEFGPSAIRKALDKRDGYKEGNRGKIYAALSEFAAHVTYRGFRLTTKDELGEIGGFIDDKQLTAWVEEMAKHLGNCARIYARHFQAEKQELKTLKAHYEGVIKEWIVKYLGAKK
jgi:hypothetical protein